MRWRIPLVVALALFVAVSCDQQPVEPAAEQVAEAPAFNFMNGPAFAGPKVQRYGDNSAWWWEDVDGYLIVVGIDPADLCGDWSTIGTTSVFTPNDDEGDEWWWGRWIDNYQVKGAPASIYEWADPFDPGEDCDDLPAALATGTGQINGNDNDFFAWNPDADTGNNNANVWGWNAHASMGGYIFNAHLNCTWLPGFEDDAKCKYRERLK